MSHRELIYYQKKLTLTLNYLSSFSGKFGIVNLCREKKSGIKLAVKYVEIKTPADRENMELEIEIMKKLQHPRLIQLYDAFDNGNQIALVLEL